MAPDHHFQITISPEPLVASYRQDFDRLCAQLAVGAAVSFDGRVRPEQDDERIAALDLEYYPSMLELQLQRVVASARQRFDSLAAAWIWHRVGSATVGEQLVLVQTAAAHRAPCFAAAQYLMDYLKTSAPIWKSYQYQGQRRWVASKFSDDQAWKRWAS